MNKNVILNLMGGLLSVNVFGANITVPDISDAMKAAEPPKINNNDVKVPPQLDIVNNEKEPMILQSGEKIFIKDFFIQDKADASDEMLNEILELNKNKYLDMKDINDISTKISKVYKDKGYMLAKAYVPKQNVKAQNDVLIIKIVLGKYGKKTLNNNSFVKDNKLKSIIDTNLKDDEVISQNKLERTMLLVGKTPGLDLPKVTVEAGEEFGQSNVIFDVNSIKRYDGYVIADNNGSIYTGEYRTMAGIGINSPFQIGDKLSLGGMYTQDGGMKNGRVDYLIPISNNGLDLELSYAKTKTKTNMSEYSQEIQDLMSSSIGDSDVYNLKINDAYLLSQIETLNLYTELSRIEKNNKSTYFSYDNEEVPKNLNVLRLGANYEKYFSLFGFNYYSNSVGEISFGKVDRDDGVNKDEDDTVGNFSKVYLEYSGNLMLNEKSSILASIKLQKALGNKSLDNSEQLTISGTSGIKAFPDAEYSADNAYVASLEYNYKLPVLFNMKHSVGAFVENGRGTYENKEFSPNLRDYRTLNDVGISYLVNKDNFFMNLRLARIIGSEDVLSEDNYDNRFLASAGMTF